MKRCIFVALFFFCFFQNAEFEGEVGPFYLTSVLSKDGKSTLTQPCIGSLIKYDTIVAPASCLHFSHVFDHEKITLATGVFIDYRPRGQKTGYSNDNSVFPINELVFSDDITIPSKHQGFGIIKLSIPFSKDNVFRIIPITLFPGSFDNSKSRAIEWFFNAQKVLMQGKYGEVNNVENRMLIVIENTQRFYLVGPLDGKNKTMVQSLRDLCAMKLPFCP